MDNQDKKPNEGKPPLPVPGGMKPPPLPVPKPRSDNLKPPPLPNLGGPSTLPPKPSFAPTPPLSKGKIPLVKPPVRKPLPTPGGALRILEVKQSPLGEEAVVKIERVYLPPTKHHDYMFQVFLITFIMMTLPISGIIKAVDVFNLQPKKQKIRTLEEAVNRMMAFRKQKELEKDAKDKEKMEEGSDATKKTLEGKTKDDGDLRQATSRTGTGKGSGGDKGQSEASGRVSQAGTGDFDPNADRNKGGGGTPETFDTEDQGAADAAEKIMGSMDDGDSGGGQVGRGNTWDTASSGGGPGGSGKYSRGSGFGPGAPGAPGSGDDNVRFNKPNVNLPAGDGPKIGPVKRTTGPKEQVKAANVGKMNFGSSTVSGQVKDEIKAQIQNVVNGGKADIRRIYNSYASRGAKIEGKMDVLIKISPDGAKSVTVSGPGLPGEFVSAVKGSINGWRFPNPGANVTLRFSFSFAQM